MRNKRTYKNKILFRVIIGVLLLAVLIAAAFIWNDLMLRSIYKQDHINYVSDMAKEYGLDAYLVASVVYAESEFEPDAVSGKGAIGLMQIMPDTGEWIAGHLKIKNFKNSMLKDPQTNLRMGCWYLNYLMDRYNSDLRLVLSAYNAGPGTVEKWLGDPEYSSDGKTITLIPFDETRQYVNKVLDANEQYKKLYPSGGTVGDKT